LVGVKPANKDTLSWKLLAVKTVNLMLSPLVT
jgi:hypothetical protein